MNRITRRHMAVKIVSLMLGILIGSGPWSMPGARIAWAASGRSEAEPIGEVRQAQGAVAVMRGGKEEPKALSDFDSVYVQDAILTRANSKLWCNLERTALDQADASLGANSLLKFFASQVQGDTSSLVAGVEHGSVRFIKKLEGTNPASAFVLATPTALVQVVPTEEAADFVIEVIDSQRTVVTVLWGKVVVKNIAEELTEARLLSSCRAVLVEQGREPLPPSGVSADRMNALISQTTVPGSLPRAIPSCGNAVVREESSLSVPMPDTPLPPTAFEPPPMLAAAPGNPGPGWPDDLGLGGPGNPGPGGPDKPADPPKNPPKDSPPIYPMVPMVPSPSFDKLQLPAPGDDPTRVKAPPAPDQKPPPSDYCKERPSGVTLDTWLHNCGNQKVPEDVTGKLSQAITNPVKVGSLGPEEAKKLWIFNPDACTKTSTGDYRCLTYGGYVDVPAASAGALKPNQRLVCTYDWKCWIQECPPCQSWDAYSVNCSLPPVYAECVDLGGTWSQSHCGCVLSPEKFYGCGDCRKAIYYGHKKGYKCLPEEPCPKGRKRNEKTCDCECPDCYEKTVNLANGKMDCRPPQPCPKGQTRNKTTCACENPNENPNPQPKCGPCDRKKPDGTCQKLGDYCSYDLTGMFPDPKTCMCTSPVYHPGLVLPPKCSVDSNCPKDWVCLAGLCFPPKNTSSNDPYRYDEKPDKKEEDPGIGSKDYPVRQPEASEPAPAPSTPPAPPATQGSPERKPGTPDKPPVAAVPSPSVQLAIPFFPQGGLKTPKPEGSIEQNPGSPNGKASDSGQTVGVTKIFSGIIPAQTKPPLKDPDAPYVGAKKPPVAAIPGPSVKPGASLATQGGLKILKPGGSIEQNPGLSSGKASARVSNQTSSAFTGSGSEPSAKTVEALNQKSQRIQGLSQTLGRDSPKLFPIQASPVRASNPVQHKAVLQSMPTGQASPVRVFSPFQERDATSAVPARMMRSK